MQILRLIVQISIILLVAFVGFKNGKIGNYLVPFILFFGVFYCGWICPFGSIQDIISKIATKLKIKRFKCPTKFQKYLVYLRYFLYTLVVIKLISMSWNPRGRFGDILRSVELDDLLYVIVAIFLIASIFIDRPWCNYFCEKGAFYGLLSTFRIFGIKRDNNTCIHCHKCDKVCPMNILVESTDFVNHPNCIGCLECVSNCPKKCLKYTKK